MTHSAPASGEVIAVDLPAAGPSVLVEHVETVEHLLPAGALAAVLLAMFSIGRYWPGQTESASNPPQAVPVVAAASHTPISHVIR